MAVIKAKRGESELKVISLGNELFSYTINILCNEKFFPKRSRWLMAGKIADLINDFHNHLHKANDTFVITQEDACERHVYQTRAYAALYASTSKMQSAYIAFHFDVNKLERWIGMCKEELKLLKAWQRNDDRRYSVAKLNLDR